MSFDGPHLNAADVTRLTGLFLRVYSKVLDGQWHTLRELAESCQGSEASISARFRDLRKARWGSHTVEKRRTAKAGVWEYRVLVPSVGDVKPEVREAYEEAVKLFTGDTYSPSRET